MSDLKNKRTKWLHLRLTDPEYNKLKKGFDSSAKRKISDYARDILLNKPITVYTRDKTMDQGIEVLGALKKELTAIGNNFNQVVKKLHTTDTSRALAEAGKEAEIFFSLFNEKTIAINQSIEEIFKKWLRV